jgi:FkbM family methyltransferase
MGKFVDVCRPLFSSPLVVVDVGAAGGVSEMESLAPLCEVHAVEPRNDSHQELTQINRQSSYGQFFSYDKGVAKTAGVYTLYVTKTPEASSLYPPNTPLIKRWRQDDVFDVAGEVDIDCITLEEMLSSKKVNYVDVIKSCGFNF